MKNKKILFIVEGEKEEPRILGRIGHDLLHLMKGDYEVIPFANPIYELYEAYKKEEFVNIVAYLHSEKGLKLEPDVLPKEAFSAIYLIFDFDPHYQKYSTETIIDILATFDNETENGKIYINYPMVESFYHLISLPDNEYNDRIISLDDFKGDKYKKLVNAVTCISKSKITKLDLYYIIKQNFDKAQYICNVKSKYVDYQEILNIQIKKKNIENKIYVLNTFALMVIDYNDTILDSINKKISININNIDEH